ncbi:MAG: tetratricopeptide repeat protein [Magnetococcales bacterium]|nr:tetratricopeptide repeat protein [Magnetococcales bacterium]
MVAGKRGLLIGGSALALLCVVGGGYYYYKSLTFMPFPKPPAPMESPARVGQPQAAAVASPQSPVTAGQPASVPQSPIQQAPESGKAAEVASERVVVAQGMLPREALQPDVSRVTALKEEMSTIEGSQAISPMTPPDAKKMFEPPGKTVVEPVAAPIVVKNRESIRQKLRAQEGRDDKGGKPSGDGRVGANDGVPVDNDLIKKRMVEDRLLKMREAFSQGRLDEAAKGFKEILTKNWENKDALFGLAAVMIRQNRLREAEGYYLKLLELNPADSVAMAGLSAIRSDVDPLHRESAIKLLLQQEPDAHHLHFALGTLYSAQKRWGEAQREFFQALSGKGDNPDYAFNLAVSLDHLGQRGAALEYYRKALVLASVQPAGFRPEQAEKRILVLGMKDEDLPGSPAREDPLRAQ